MVFKEFLKVHLLKFLLIYIKPLLQTEFNNIFGTFGFIWFNLILSKHSDWNFNLSRGLNRRPSWGIATSANIYVRGMLKEEKGALVERGRRGVLD